MMIILGIVIFVFMAIGVKSVVDDLFSWYGEYKYDQEIDEIEQEELYQLWIAELLRSADEAKAKGKKTKKPLTKGK